MSDLNIQLCPEKGICSIIKKDGNKVDLVPGEVSQIREASGNADTIRQTLAQIDSGFAEGLDSEEIGQISTELE